MPGRRRRKGGCQVYRCGDIFLLPQPRVAPPRATRAPNPSRRRTQPPPPSSPPAAAGGRRRAKPARCRRRRDLVPRLEQGPRGAASSGVAAELGGRRVGWRALVCGAARPAGRGGTSLERAGRWRRGVLRGGSEAAASLVRTALLRRRGVLVGEVGRIPSAARAARSRWALVMARGGPGLPASDRRRSWSARDT